MKNSCEANSCSLSAGCSAEWKGEHKSALRVFNEMSHVGLVSCQRTTHNSMYDAIAATSIPVVDVANITRYMPFQDMIDWNLGLLNGIGL